MRRKFILPIGIILAFTFLLAGCGEKQRVEAAKKLAGDYLGELKVQVSDETIYLTDAEAGNFGEMIAFTAYSGKYGGDFSINVNTDDSVSDSYYALSLKDSANREFSELLASVFPDECPAFELSVKNVVSSALSGKTFGTIQEAHEAIDNAAGLINVVITPSGTSGISDKSLDSLLNAMQKAGFDGDLSVLDDVRVFHISGTEINYTRTDDGPGEVRVYNWVSDTDE